MATRERLSLIRSTKAAGLRSVIDASAFGFVNYTTAALPDRVFTGLDEAERPPSVLHGEAEIDVDHVPTPLDALLSPTTAMAAWPTETKKALRRLEALWLLTEDRFRLLDASTVEPLAHQASLVEHVLASPDLHRVLIADEVGLGKTVEAGLIIMRLMERQSGTLRVLYLTEARLVRNVIDEFERLGLRPREWSAQTQSAVIEANHSDPLVVASMHRAAVNLDKVAASGPWDVIVIDEAHHLSDWSEDGSDPQRRMKLCRRLIADRLVPDGRVILLSGTPHQGSSEKFKNLLRLLDEGGEHSGARGKVIYRIKDDITDWSGQPLFPRRQINPPIQIAAPPEYSVWLAAVHELLTPLSGNRAMGWRRAQALQWCASSPQAGLAYLVRLALRAGLSRRSMSVLDEAMESLRPYRDGTESEPVEAVEARLMRAQELMGEDAEEVFQDPRRGLGNVLKLGVHLVKTDALACKLRPVFNLMDASASEKFVVFAQPVDTVFTLKRRFEARFGKSSVSLIVGGQRPDERRNEIAAFRDGNSRVLVSSRSGGEGINLQVARRLIHFDVPWNPMEMEQRVGRIHRYGSTDTVLVDTLVLDGSREQRVLARSRARLGKIAAELDQDRIEVLFSRTMSFIPLEEIAALMAGENFGPLTPDDEDRIDRLITTGYAEWLKKDEEFRAKSEQLQGVARGAASETAYRAFLIHAVGAKPATGWLRRHFEAQEGGGAPHLVEVEAEVLELPDGTTGYVGRHSGIGLHHSHAGEKPIPLGLNHPRIAELVRQAAGESGSQKEADVISGAGVLRIARKDWAELLGSEATPSIVKDGGIVLAYQRRMLDVGTSMRELNTDLHAWVVSADGKDSMGMNATQVGDLISRTRGAGEKRTLPSHLDGDALRHFEGDRLRELGRDHPSKPFIGVFPLLALWVEPAGKSVEE